MNAVSSECPHHKHEVYLLCSVARSDNHGLHNSSKKNRPFDLKSERLFYVCCYAEENMPNRAQFCQNSDHRSPFSNLFARLFPLFFFCSLPFCVLGSVTLITASLFLSRLATFSSLYSVLSLISQRNETVNERDRLPIL